ncbi:MAG TPA: SRPBCC family protein, partial [Saprospiraceae bacterium]|nr:SRPBCC family protein [Saprospiraceae bacterium]
GLYKNYLNDRRVYLSKEDADVVIEKDFPIPPALLWDWINDPRQRTRWSPGSDWNMGFRPMGRRGKGATNHCVNSKVVEKILDYRPFDYYTSSMGRGFFNIMLTSEFKEIPSGTRLSWHVKMNSILPKGISRFLCRLIIKKGMRVDKSFDILSGLIQRDQLAKEVLVS